MQASDREDPQGPPPVPSQTPIDPRDEDRLKCPKCGSTQIHIDKKGYSGGKGCCGFLACGPLGFLLGTRGANQIQKHCLKCNHSWS